MQTSNINPAMQMKESWGFFTHSVSNIFFNIFFFFLFKNKWSDQVLSDTF